MKFVLGFVATAAMALAMGGCGSSSDGGDGLGDHPDFASVNARFDKPDGTFSAGNASQVFERGSEGSSSAAGLDFSGSSSSSSGSSAKKSVGLQILDATSGRSSPFSCSPFAGGQRSGSCSCPAGGSVDYVIESDGQAGSGVANAIMKFNMNACATSDSLINGSEYFEIHTDTTDRSHPLYSLLFLVDATVTHAGVTKHVDLQARYANGAAEIAVKVDDGWVVVSVKSSNNGQTGTWTVRDKNGSWTCNVDNGHGTCSSDKGETRSF